MKVVFHEDFYQVYASDPAAAPGRMEAVVAAIKSEVDFVVAEPASESDILAVHTAAHVGFVRHQGLYPIAALAAGGAFQAAELGLNEPAFGLVRPPGHHASAGSCWGFCYFNNMAIALKSLKQRGQIQTACVLDIDLHFGDGTMNLLGGQDYVTVHNIDAGQRKAYLEEVDRVLEAHRVDLIGLSAGFDNHRADWGGLLETEDYFEIGAKARRAALKNGGGCFAVLEGGYNHAVLGQNVTALIEGLARA